MTGPTLRATMGLLLLGACSQPCPPEERCSFGKGSYRVDRAPHGADKAVFFLHGAQMGGDGVRHRLDLSPFHDRGIDVVFPNAPRKDWRVARPKAVARDARWLADLADHLAGEGLPTDVAVAGHSVGGSMTWFTACHAGDRFYAFAPSSGGYWEPEPATCDVGPVRLRHHHGRFDTFVPLGGRYHLKSKTWQANVESGLETWRHHGGCDGPTVQYVDGPYLCEATTDCDAGVVELCLYDGRHPKPEGWEEAVAAWLAEG